MLSSIGPKVPFKVKLPKLPVKDEKADFVEKFIGMNSQTNLKNPELRRPSYGQSSLKKAKRSSLRARTSSQ